MSEDKQTTPEENTSPKKMSKKKKILTVIGIIFAIILLAVILIPGIIVKNIVPPIASQLLKVKVEMDSCFINVFDGAVRVRGLKVHNPEGYDAPYAFELGHFYVDVKMTSLLSPKIEIADIIIEDMHATLEMKLGTNNLQDISNNLPKPKEDAEKEEEKEEPAEKDEKEPKKMVIRHFKIEKSDFTMLKVPWPIPSLELTDVGDGRPITDFVVVVYDAILDAVIQASKTVSDGITTVGKGIGKAAGKAGENIGNAAGKAGDAVVEGTTKVLDEAGKSIKNLFSK